MTENRDFGAEAQAAAEKHLEACWEALYAERDAEADDVDINELPESPAIGAFCGCETCEIREVLHAAWPFLKEAALAGVE